MADATLQPGARVAHFEVVRLLGAGGFANVYLARDLQLDRRVALKIPRGSTELDPQIRLNHQKEGRAAARLHHPNIISVFEVGEVGGYVFISADYCDGPTLAKWRRSRDSPVPHRMAAQIVERLAQATKHAHLCGLIHRDVKPANVLLDPNQADAELPFSPKLTDFGLARVIDSDATLTASGVLKGTPRYMAPEQAQAKSDEMSPACDVYSLGVILYELLTGKVPIKGDTQVDTLRRLVSDVPPLPRRMVRSLPRDLEAITMKCLEKDPAGRYQSAGPLADDLDRYLNGRPTVARPLGMMQRFSRWAAHNPAIAGATVISLLVLTVAAVFLTVNNQRLEKMNIRLEDVTRSQADLLYAADIQIAARSIKDGDLRQAQKLLDQHIPTHNESDRRGMEWTLLRNQISRTGVTLSAHTGSVYMVRYSPDGSYLASCGEDGKVRVFDRTAHTLLTTPYSLGHEINGIAFSPDSSRLATADDSGRVHVFDLSTLQEVVAIPACNTLAFQVVFTPDGGTIYTCGDDVDVKKWNAETGEFLGTVGTHSTSLEGIDLSADGKYLASACTHEGYIWEVATGRLIHHHKPASHIQMTNVTFSPDGVVAWGTLKRGCILEKIDEAGEVTLLTAEFDHADAVQSATLSDDGNWMATADRGGTVCVRSMDELNDRSVVMSPTGSPRNESTVAPQLWKAHDGRVWWVEFSPDGSELASAGADGTVKIWPVGTGQSYRARRRQSLAQGIGDFAALRDQRLAVTEGHSVSLWDLSGESPARSDLENGSTEEWRRVAVSGVTASDYQYVIAGSSKGVIRVWNSRTQKFVSEWSDEATRDVVWLGVRPDVSQLIAKLDGSILAFELPTLERIDGLPDLWCNAVAIAPSGRWCAVANRGRDTIDLRSSSSWEVVHTFSGHTSTVSTLVFSPDESLLVSGGDGRTVRTWNVNTGQLVHELYGHLSSVVSLSFAADGRRLLSSSSDGITHLWSLPSGRRLLTLGQHYTGIDRGNKTIVSPDSRSMIRLSDTLVEVYDVRLDTDGLRRP